VLGVGGAAGLLLAGRLAPRAAEDEDVSALAVHTARWLALSGIGLLCTALAPSAVLAVASLAIVGLGTGGQQPVLLALIGRVTPPASRALAFGMTALFLGLGAILSLLLFGVGESTGYRLALVVAGVLVVGAGAVVHSARGCVVRDLADIAAAAPVG
jgi:MFS family permease